MPLFSNMQTLETVISAVGNALSDWLLIPMLLIAAIWFTIRTRGVQFGMVGEMVLLGGLMSFGLVWSLADITMSLMALCNLEAILVLGRYALFCLKDYRRQRRQGHNPVYHADTQPEIASKTPCWPDR